MPLLTKDAILNAQDLQRVEVEVPEWGGTVWIRTLTGNQRDVFEASLMKANGKTQNLTNVRGRFAALVVCDESGTQMFNDAEAMKLGEKSAAALNRIWDAGTQLNGIGEEAVKELEKNSGATLGGDSNSA